MPFIWQQESEAELRFFLLKVGALADRNFLILMLSMRHLYFLNFSVNFVILGGSYSVLRVSISK